MSTRAQEIFAKAKKEERKLLTVYESLELLKSYKIPVAESAIASSADEAEKASDKIGYPVVLKIISKKITHKTDIGGVVTAVRSAEAARDSFERILENAKKADAKADGVIVQKMVEDGLQVIIGGKKDPQFGQTIAFGLGGVFVEAFEDVAFRIVPIKKADAEEMMKDTKCYKVLAGYRGKSYDTEALANLLIKVSDMLEDNQGIAELDINPIIVLQKGAIAVDARVILE